MMYLNPDNYNNVVLNQHTMDTHRSTGQEAKSSIQILLAEDNVVNQVVATSFLEKFGYSVDLAEDGKKALSLSEKKAYDLILMDIQMPEMDGLETTKCIRNQSQNPNKNSKIIAMTASVLKSEIEKCFIAGMDEYIEKPFDPNELEKKLSHMFYGPK